MRGLGLDNGMLALSIAAGWICHTGLHHINIVGIDPSGSGTHHFELGAGLYVANARGSSDSG